MKIVIDSSILIDYLRGGKKWGKFLQEAPRRAELFLPTIVIFELFSGQSAKNSVARKDLSHLLQQFTQVELSETTAITAGELYRQFGKQIGVSDYLIAASALELNAPVVTLNKKHFAKIPQLSLYEL